MSVLERVRRRRGWAAVVVLYTLLAGARAGAQAPYRQTVVVTASAVPATLDTVAGTVSVLTRDQIAALPVTSVADAVRVIGAVDVRARGERGVQTDFSARGAGFGQMLVMIDGVRLNDVQSGHHNGDIPVPLEAVERIEVLHGGGSALFGADAVGGTINIITRSAPATRVVVHGGTFASAGVRGGTGFTRGGVSQTFDVAFDRSSGFTSHRDFNTVTLRSSTSLGPRTRLSVAALRKEFGAANFYGGNAPSREWTDGVLLSGTHRGGAAAGWGLDVSAAYRIHGDRFVFDWTDPSRSDNRHRTHALLARAAVSRPVRVAGTLTLGGEAAGDWIRSSNLGNHARLRGAAFGEWRQPVGARAHLEAAVRLDGYQEFGAAATPSLGVSWRLRDAVRLRASTGRAFRVPTFTEQYYADPANRARAEIQPERAWVGEAGGELFLPRGWVIDATVFGRRDTDVIDWLRPTPQDIWQTYNIRDIRTAGLELGAKRTFAGGGFLMTQVTLLDLDAPTVDQLSKYALDYASRAFVAAGSVPLPAGIRLASRIQYRHRVRAGADGGYVLIDGRVAKRVARGLELTVDGSNLLDARYQEVAGVPMPGATVLVSLGVGH